MSVFKTGGHRVVWTGGLLLCGALGLTGCGGDGDGGSAAGGERPPAAVTVAPVERATVEVERVYAGRARGEREVEVRARVSGILERRLYDEGQRVEEGDALFQIERDPFAVALERAEAEMAVARANLGQAEREWERVSGLFESNAVSERERDTAEADLALARANLAVAQSGVAEAELNLGYTRVEAPLSGITSLEVLAEGSLVSEGTLLTTIVHQDPIHVRFSLPEEDAVLRRAARRALRGDTAEDERSATLLLPDGSDYGHPGSIDFTASTVDPETGTVLARAIFPNPEGEVLPGQFVRVRVLLERLEDVLVVPETAIAAGPDGPRLFVVTEEGQAEARAVRLGPARENRRVMLEGVEAGERVVVEGLVGLQDGAPVAVGNDSEEAR